MKSHRFVEIYSNDTMDTTLAAVVATVKGCVSRINSHWPAKSPGPSVAFLVLGHVDFQCERDLRCAHAFLSRSKSMGRFPAVVIIASNLSDDRASIQKQKELLDLGVLEILERPLNLQRLRYIIDAQKTEFDFRCKQRKEVVTSSCLSNACVQLHKKLEKVAAVDTNVLLSGETGVGKTYWAEFVHKKSARAKHPFVVVNCANFTQTLVESQLFGHTKGAFTGADRNQPGQFEHAGSGTILLDEIDSLSLEVQAKLLRVVENREFQRLGDHRPIPMQARILSATNQSLDDLIVDRRFRADLFYRLNAYEIQIPPLRNRQSDIESLSHFFAEEFSAANRQPVKSFDQAVIRMLQEYPWPGNLRELRNCVQYGAIDSDTMVIRENNLPHSVRDYFDNQETLKSTYSSIPLQNEHRITAESSEFNEVHRLVTALEHNNYNRSRAAKELGVSRMTVYNMLKRHKLD